MNDEQKKLKITIVNFLSASSRVLRADINFYCDELRKFMEMLENEQVIMNYIKNCGEPEYNIEEEYKDVLTSYGRKIFNLGTTKEKEVANIYALLKYLISVNIRATSSIFIGYLGKTYQNKIDDFGTKVIQIFIYDIELFLKNETLKFDDNKNGGVNIIGNNISSSQLNIVGNNGNVMINNSINIEELKKYIEELKKHIADLKQEDKEIVNECLRTIVTIKNEDCNSGLIKMAIKALNAVNGGVEFSAAVVTLIQFISQYLH